MAGLISFLPQLWIVRIISTSFSNQFIAVFIFLNPFLLFSLDLFCFISSIMN
jgi:hypothetical protein